MNSELVPAIIVAATEYPSKKVPMRLALFDESGDPVVALQEEVSWDEVADKPSTFTPATHTHVGSAVVLTGYASGSADDLSATDTVNEAFAKLEARIAALETP